MENKKIMGERGKQILVGGLIILTITTLVVSLLIGWRLIPGWVGESFGTVAGVMSTPFFMEASFALIGLMTVVGLNSWRRHKDGDELVYLEPEKVEDATSSKEPE